MKRPEVTEEGWLSPASLLGEEPHTIECQGDKIRIFGSWYREVFEFDVKPTGAGQVFGRGLIRLAGLRPRTYYSIKVSGVGSFHLDVQIEQQEPERPGALW